MSRFPEITALADRARTIQAQQEQCERQGGHYYQVDGFSAIAHPEVFYGDLPHVDSLSQVVFRGYVCRGCGRRTSVEAGRKYMRNKPLSFEQQAQKRIKQLERDVPNWRDYSL